MQSQAEPEVRKLSFCIEQYMKSLDDCQPGTIDRVQKYLDRFLGEVGDLKVSRLKAHHLSDHIKGGGWKPSTIRCVLATINACLNRCERKDWIARNPLRGKVRMPGIERCEEGQSRSADPGEAGRGGAEAVPVRPDLP